MVNPDTYGPCECRWLKRGGDLIHECFFHQAWRQALEIIAGKRQSADSLKSNQDIAADALNLKRKKS